MTGVRCIGCGDPAPRGFEHCLHCHAWSDLIEAFRYGNAGIDEFRLTRARNYFANRNAEPIESLLRKLTRRVQELEALTWYRRRWPS